MPDLTFTADQYAALCDALGAVRLSDGAPLVLTPDQVIDLVRQLRDIRVSALATLPDGPPYRW